MWAWVMTFFLTILMRYVAPFLMGVCVAAAVEVGDMASFSALLSVGCLWFFSTSLPKVG